MRIPRGLFGGPKPKQQKYYLWVSVVILFPTERSLHYGNISGSNPTRSNHSTVDLINESSMQSAKDNWSIWNRSINQSGINLESGIVPVVARGYSALLTRVCSHTSCWSSPLYNISQSALQCSPNLFTPMSAINESHAVIHPGLLWSLLMARNPPTLFGSQSTSSYAQLGTIRLHSKRLQSNWSNFTCARVVLTTDYTSWWRHCLQLQEW